MSLERIEALLSKRIGVDITIIGSRKIARAVEARRTACGLPHVAAYLNVLQTSAQEFDELVERIVVPETWFFRDRKPFDFLINHVRLEGSLQVGSRKLRLLSAPCSTGEEPYSIAIAMLEAGLPTHRFSVEGIDISKHAIATAQRAVYGKNSFRGADWVDRSRYFQPTDDKYELCESVRSLVTCRQTNLLHGFSSTQAKYDVIFCRNLLIYLEAPVCDQVFTLLDRLLLPGGLLFVGSSETGKVPNDRFLSVRQPSTFAYRKEATQPASQLRRQSSQQATKQSFSVNQKTPDQKNSGKKIQFPTIAKVSDRTFQHESNVPLAASETKPSTVLDSVHTASTLSLKLARQLADAGQIDAAINHCQAYLEQDSTNAEAHTLLGTLYQTIVGDRLAEGCFRKALYLKPHDYDALMHLALLKEHRGDLVGAKILQQRIQKLQQLS